MPASIQNLYSQSRSLQAYSHALQVTGQNIASSADPNYHRQQVTLQSAQPGSLSSQLGSSVNTVVKDTRDPLIESQIRREQSGLGYQTEELGYAKQLELSLFPGNDGPLGVTAAGGDHVFNGLTRSLQAFFDSWVSLETSPSGQLEKQSVLGTAESLVDRFKVDAESLAELRATAEEGLAASVSKVNEIVAQVASLQERLSRLPSAQVSGRVELESMRDSLLSELSEYTSFTWSAPEGAPLAATLSVRLADGTNAALVTGSQVTDTLTGDATQVRLASSGARLAADDGRLGAQRQFLETELTEWENHWNLLAGEIGRVVNAVYNPDGIEGEDFFDADSLTAAGLRLSVTSASALRAGLPGESGKVVAERMGALLKADLNADFGSPIAGSFTDDLLDRQNMLARQIQRHGDGVSAQEKVVAFLEEEKSARSGVDLDAEVTQLIQFQRSFQATSRVLRALDEALLSFLSDIA